MFWFILFLIIILTEMFIYPRIDFAGGKLLFWYGVRTRKFVILWEFNK